MTEYKNVFPGHAISVKIFDLMEDVDPAHFNGASRAGLVKQFNDIIQGRNEMGVDAIVRLINSDISPRFPNEAAILCRYLADFERQKHLISTPYSKSSSKNYRHEIFDPGAEMPLKIITQGIYDRALNDGFPPNFFRESYFDSVTLYCIPDNADFAFSALRNCMFSVCRVHGANFDGTSIYDTEFHTADMRNVTFYKSTIANTHFHDCALSLVSFQSARLKSCNTIDCVMDRINYLNTTLNGCSYGRITASGIKNLDTATITMGGATNEECQNNRESIYKALQPVADPPPPERPPARPRKHRKRDNPER